LLAQASLSTSSFFLVEIYWRSDQCLLKSLLPFVPEPSRSLDPNSYVSRDREETLSWEMETCVSWSRKWARKKIEGDFWAYSAFDDEGRSGVAGVGSVVWAVCVQGVWPGWRSLTGSGWWGRRPLTGRTMCPLPYYRGLILGCWELASCSVLG
jgi:hypothetical protein